MNAVRIGAAAVVAATALAACGSNVAAPSVAIVTGGVRPCQAIAIPGSPDYAAATVTVLRGVITWKPAASGDMAELFPSDVVTSTRVPVNGTYRFGLAPGSYVLRATFSVHPQPGDAQPYTDFTVEGGQTITRDISNQCI